MGLIYLDLRVLEHSLSWRYRYCYSAYRQQPPPSLPRRGGTDSIGYLIITHSNLIIGDLSLTIVTCNSQSLTKQSNCPSPSGEDRWGLKWLTGFSSRVIRLGFINVFCLYIKVVVTPHTAIQPPPNLPRRGGTDTIGYLIITHSNLIITHSNLIIGDLSLTIVTCNSQSLTKQSNCPSPSIIFAKKIRETRSL